MAQICRVSRWVIWHTTCSLKQIHPNSTCMSPNQALFVFVLSVGHLFPSIAQSGMAIEILEPVKRARMSRSGQGIVVGQVANVNASVVQLLTQYSQRSYVDVGSREEKETFPGAVRGMIPAEVLLQRLSVKHLAVRGREEKKEYEFTVQDRMDLRKFWGSRYFKEILTRVAEKTQVGIEIQIQGWKLKESSVATQAYRARFGSIFNFSFPLTPGLNMIFVRAAGAEGGTLQIDTVRFFYRTALLSESGSNDFDLSAFHTPEREARCVRCHTMELPEAVKRSRGIVEQDCRTCHSVLVTQRSAHAPAAGWDCLMCHDAGSDPKYALYRDKSYDATLCFECHVDVQEKLASSPSTHAPAASGDCLTCHDPHGSGQRSFLVSRVNDLCLSCHDQVATVPHPVVGHPLEGRADPLKPGREIECTSCHDPHASNSPLLLPTESSKLCRLCHEF